MTAPMGRKPVDPLEVAGRALRRQDLSIQALSSRLARAGVPEHERGETIARLAEAGLVDDQRLACGRAARLAARGYGDALIDARLEHEGIAASERSVALDGLPPEHERAAAAAGRMHGERPRRIAAALARRGFSQEAVESAVARLDEVDDPALR